MKTIIIDDNIKEIVDSMIDKFGYDIKDIGFKQGYKESIISRTADIWLSESQFACFKKFLTLIGERDFIITQMGAFDSACKLDAPVFLVDSDVEYDEYYNLPLMDTSIAFSKNANWVMCIAEGLDYGTGVIAVKDDLSEHLSNILKCEVIMIPFYLANHLANIKEKKDKTTGVLTSSTGNTDLEIYYYGELIQIGKTPYIGDGEYPCLIVAKDRLTKEEFVVFDGAKHGYDGMFCNDPIGDIERELKPYEYAKGKLEITFGYAIDYEDEKDDYEFNDNEEVKLIDGSYIDWDKAKSIGFDWISIKSLDKKKVFVDLELA